jgi:TetR/AcrR family transcriptional regulator, repressor for uid operon
MNIHFHAFGPSEIMIATDAPSANLPERRSLADRRAMILDAFERCIVRAGFHRTTMQDVAKEAGMSAGNLYRYFASKDQLVSGLCERDRERFSADFANVAEAADVMGGLIALGRKHFVEEPRTRCVQFLEIWAEATRNPAVAAVCSAMDREVHSRLVAIIDAAKEAGQVPPHVDSSALISTVSALGDGLFMRRALDPDFDAEEGFRLLLAVMEGIMTGGVAIGRGANAPAPPARPSQPPIAV